MRLGMVVFAALATGGCLGSRTVVCDDGAICPAGTTCVRVTAPDQDVCAVPAQLDECKTEHEHERCGKDGATDGRCYGGVCLPIACGNGRVDVADPADPHDSGELCDDGNQIPGDGCSPDCRSDETCGNGVLDPIHGELCDDGNRIQHDGCDSACRPEAPRWVERTPEVPPLRTGAAMAYDAARGKVVMFGGTDANSGLLGDTWEWDGVGWSQLTPLRSPLPRTGHAMAYDAARRRVVLFGGSAATGYLSDTWEWDGTTWTAAPVLTAPAPRSDHAMAYDSGRQRIVLFGGAGLQIFTVAEFGDTWEWDGTQWTKTADGGPPPRLDMAMAYDPVRARTVLFGGSAGTLGDTWEYDGATATWQPGASGGPSPRAAAAMTYDPTSRALLLFGGADGTGALLDDAWRYDGTWRAGPFGPGARSSFAMTTDVDRGRAILFGGTGADASTWELAPSPDLWQRVLTESPPPQGALAVAHDPDRGRSVFVGKSSLGATTWLYLGFGFLQVTPAMQPLLIDHVIAHDDLHDEDVLFDATGATWLWNGKAWAPVTPAVSPPPLTAPAIAYDRALRRVILFGGTDAGDVDHDETWAWDGATWLPLAPAHRPPARHLAIMATDPVHDQIVLFGGLASGAFLGDTWLWDGTDWSAAAPKASPEARDSTAMTWNAPRQRLTLFAGRGIGGSLSDTWEWDGATWSQVAVGGAPPQRFNHAMVPSNDGTGVVVFGGQQGVALNTRPLGDLWLLRWDGDGTDETCRLDHDDDGDHLVGCADPDCWTLCAPQCPPGAPCDPSAPRCGDGVCDIALENCRMCPSDCTCDASCGDGWCDPPEDHASCPGDCP